MAFETVLFKACGRVHRIAPDIVGELSDARDARDHFATVYADADVETVIARLRLPLFDVVTDLQAQFTTSKV